MFSMFYVKNVPVVERWIRAIVGIALVAFAVAGLFHVITLPFSPWLELIAIVSAITLVLTGSIGWCPACYLFGRTLKKKG